MSQCAFWMGRFPHNIDREMQCFDEKAKDAAAAMDHDLSPWLNTFIWRVGIPTAKMLLAGAGNYVKLTSSNYSAS